MEITSEKWVTFSEAPLYEVSDLGRVRHKTTGRILKSHRALKGKSNYPKVTLARGDGWSKLFSVHRVVAHAFLGPAPAKCDVNHKDDDRTNNAVENLEYVSHHENMRLASETGRLRKGDRHQGSILTEAAVREIRALEGIESPGSLMKRFGVERKTLYNARKRITWRSVL